MISRIGGTFEIFKEFEIPKNISKIRILSVFTVNKWDPRWKRKMGSVCATSHLLVRSVIRNLPNSNEAIKAAAKARAKANL
jgi:hypothetical protein